MGRRAVGLALAGMMLVAVVGCSDDDTANETETEDTVAGTSAAELLGPDNPASGEPVKIGLVSDGATAAFDNTDELRSGQATAEYFNAHKAGVGGRPIELVTCETGGDPAGALDCANRMIEQGVVAVTLSQSAVTAALWEPLHAAGVPTFFTQSSGDAIEQDRASSFMVFNPLATFFSLPIEVAQAEQADKIAFVVIDVPQAYEIIEGDGARVLQDAGLEYEVFRVPVGTADMTSRMQEVVSSGATVAHVVGNDAFCIAAFQGLTNVSFTGTTTAISQCFTDATREALPGGLEGINVLSTLAVGATDDPTYQLFQAVMETYGQDVEDVDNLVAMGGYAAVAALATAMAGISGEVNFASVIAAIRAMPESEYPGGGGVMYRCGGTASPDIPPVCTNQWLRTVLDAAGEPTSYTVSESSGI